MKQITDNENQNFEILSEEISEFAELEVLNSNDRKIFEVFLDLWNISVYPKFVMLAQQGPKEGSAKAVELVRRIKSIIDSYNRKIKNYQLYSSADAPLEYQRRFNEVYSYFESFADKKKKLNRGELDIFEEKINEFFDIINPPKKMSRASLGACETPAAEAARTASIDSRPQRKTYKTSEKQRSEQAGQAYNQPQATPQSASRSAPQSQPQAGNQRQQPPSDDILNELKNAESAGSDSRATRRGVSHAVDSAVAPGSGGGPLKNEKPKESGCGIGCFTMLFCMAAGAGISGGSGFAAGLFIGFFLGMLISDIAGKNYKDIEGGFLFNGFLIGMVFGIYFGHVVFGIIIGLIASKIAASVIIKK